MIPTGLIAPLCISNVGFPCRPKRCSAVERASSHAFLPGPSWDLHDPKPIHKGVDRLRRTLSTPGKSPGNYVSFQAVPSSCEITLLEHPESLLGQRQGREDLLIAAASSHRSLEDISACSSPIVCRVMLWTRHGGMSSLLQIFPWEGMIWAHITWDSVFLP